MNGKQKSTTKKPSKRKQANFLAKYALSGNITRAAEDSGIDRGSHYLWMEDDEDYQEAFGKLNLHVCGMLEDEAIRRAVEGIDKCVGYDGDDEPIITTQYSDTLLIFLLKGFMGNKYKDRTEVSGPNNGPLQYQVVEKCETPEPSPSTNHTNGKVNLLIAQRNGRS